MQSVLDTAAVRAPLSWLVFVERESLVRDAIRFPVGRAPPLLFTLGTAEDGARLFNQPGVPYSVLVDARGSVRTIVAGNGLLPAREIAAACSSAP